MRKLNRKGFTLVELIATIVVLVLVMSIGAYSITEIIKSSKEKNYELLIKNIKDGAETYYQECKYSNNSGITCSLTGDTYTTTLGDLVKYGYLKGNTKKENNNSTGYEYGIENPNDNTDISSCQIKVNYQNGKISITPISSSNTSCPSSYN